jgi:hypothetical protein
MSGGNAQWYWNASSNPFDPAVPAVWTAYSANDNKSIEQAFESQANKAELQNHIIHFRENMQVHRTDHHRQRPVKRELKN